VITNESEKFNYENICYPEFTPKCDNTLNYKQNIHVRMANPTMSATRLLCFFWDPCLILFACTITMPQEPLFHTNSN